VLRDPAIWIGNIRDLRVSTVDKLTADIDAFCPVLDSNREVLDQMQAPMKRELLPLAMEASAQQAVFRAQQVEIQARIATVSASHQLAHRLKNISSPTATPSPPPSLQQQILAASAEEDMDSIEEAEEESPHLVS
jgi:hypothetical protein